MINPQLIQQLINIKNAAEVLMNVCKNDEVINSAETPAESKFYVNIQATMRNTHNLLKEYLSEFMSFTPDEYLCNPTENEIYSSCVFDNPLVCCDKKDAEGKDIECKEKCPYWKKYKDVKKV